MTVQATEPLYSDVYVSSGVELAFPFPFSAFRDSDVGVAIRAPGAESWTPLDYGADYTVGRNPAPVIGGTVHLPAPLASGWQLIAYANIEFSQDRKFENQSGLFLFEIEASLDKLTAMAKLLADDAERAPRTDRFTGGRGLIMPEPSPGRALIGRPDGAGWTDGPTDTEIANAGTYANEAKTARGEAKAARDEAVDARNASQTAQGLAEAARDSAVATAHYGVVSSIAQLRSLPITVDGRVARVLGRQGGYFKFQMGDLTAAVASDPYGGLWVAPSSAPTGASGAWQRMVEKSIYDAEWWLPDVMPANAQEMINAGIISIPDASGKFLMPRRAVSLTGSVRLTKGLLYEGFGKECPLDGGGGNFFSVEVCASNARLNNISAGNVYGQLAHGEPGGFTVYDGEPYWNGNRAVENVSAKDCHAYDAECGFRAGMSAWTSNGGSPGVGSAVEIFASRDIYLENFQAEGIERNGIECMRANGVEIVGGKVRMSIPDTIVGFDRGVRLAGAHNIHISGLHIVASDTTTVRGISVESASQGGDPVYTYGGSTNVTVEAVTVEDCAIGMSVTGGFSRNVSFRNNKLIGRREGFNSNAFTVNGNSTSNGYGLEQTPHIGVTIDGNEAVNMGTFLTADGHVYNVSVRGNLFISNTATGTAAHCFIYSSSGTEKKFVEWYVEGNRSYTPGTNNNEAVRMQNLHADSDLSFNDNMFSGDNAGRVWGITGDATVRVRELSSNRTIPSSKWAEVRPPLDQDDYPVGDYHLIRPIGP